VYFCYLVTPDYPLVFRHITVVVYACVWQHFIFVTISTFGPLTCSIITTTRKFFTILSSVILFHHPVTVLQWFATTLVFAGLMLDTIFGKERRATAVAHKVVAIMNSL